TIPSHGTSRGARRARRFRSHSRPATFTQASSGAGMPASCSSPSSTAAFGPSRARRPAACSRCSPAVTIARSFPTTTSPREGLAMHTPLHYRGSRRLAGLFVLALGLTGCSHRYYPVHGKVTLDDGTPLKKGLVVFESAGAEKAVTARGEIKEDGS